ncbi:hypothetical protein HO133_005371 [Letharia lupina]|uniref:histone acetyltransferase n=1 Tax=Letharia lupina TaxID=560253 RepID=A0A8H6C8R2_9LECA|nr:uncharacterized protein HO133_005371 [Letharia lupina]KAF6218828.1 hypothetical protein HO133_005371 [Letharia lupina]
MIANGYSPILEERLARSLPDGCCFTIHHLSTPPTACPAIYAAPPKEEPEETYCESHFLSVSIDSDGSQLQVFAIEVLIYTTEYLTTLFVSKADSTGYLYLHKLPHGTPSPLRIVSTTFLQYLIEDRERSDRRLVLSLFARAQNQYLFPGSIENNHKHILDDRGLIKWWCKVLNPILGTSENDSNALEEKRQGIMRDELDFRSHGFLRVPGCDTYETQSFLPRDESGRIAKKHRWLTKDPLRELGRSPGLPERCLIPRFPDDPKARFVETLDDEIPDEESQLSLSQTPASPSKKQNNGRWRSVKSLEQFWEMMQFRQECSSGRLVGFLWATFQPNLQCAGRETIDDEKRPQSALPTPLDSQDEECSRLPPESPLRSSPAPELPPSTPQKLISLEQTPTPTPVKRKQATAMRDLPEETTYYYWPKSSRGEVILRQKDYQRAGSLLLRLDYADEKVGTDSTGKWISDVAKRAGLKTWGRHVVGKKTTLAKRDPITDAKPAMLNAGLIRKKKRPAEEMNGGAVEARSESKRSGITTLSGGLVRKRAKVAGHIGPVLTEDTQSNGKTEPG